FICCRNLLIYLSGEIQKRIIPLFHYSLNPGGILFLGSAETIGAPSGLFSPLDGKTRIYRRTQHSASNTSFELRQPSLRPRADGSSEHPNEDLGQPKAPVNLQSLVDRILVQRFSPVGALCNDKGDVLYISGRAGKYLEPSVGKVNVNIFAMARDGLRFDLSRAFSAALRDGGPITARGVKVGTNGGTQRVDI